MKSKVFAIRLLSLIILFVTSSFYLNSYACLKEARWKLYQEGPLSDIPFSILDLGTWPVNKPILHPMNQKLLAIYDFETHLIQYSGSYHSGWFQGLVVTKSDSCEFIEFLNTYSE